MEYDNTFRIILIVGGVIAMPTAAYFLVKSGMLKERVSWKDEGIFLLLTLRPVAFIRLMGMLAFMIHPPWMSWSSVPLPLWLRWVGVALVVTGAAIISWTFRSLGKNLTDTVVPREHATLVTDGPYRWVRHPFYSGFIVGAVADPLITANWFIALGGVLLLGLLVMRSRREEDRLIERFGQAYQDYMQRTGSFFPRRLF